jgi:hypothetical protein
LSLKLSLGWSEIRGFFATLRMTSRKRNGMTSRKRNATYFGDGY